MADFRRGIKAGAAVAAVYLIISVIFEVSGFSDQFSDITVAAGLHIGSLHMLRDPSFVIYLILGRIARGIVFGAVFAALYDFLPGTAAVKKGVVLPMFLWILGAVYLIYMTPGWPADWFLTSTMAGLPRVFLSSIGLALVSIISALVFGALVVFIWNRLGGRKTTETREGSAALLVSFILGGVIWVVSAVELIMVSVISGGIPAIEPRPFWWYSILSTSVVFLGLPGWVLTLVASRKTKRGESGFKWGVAGGIIMALTGQMLLAGVLAIIGGVVNRREPATQSDIVAIEQ